jgi:Putative adhesin
MTTVTGPVTGPPRAPARLTMTPGRRVTLLIGIPVALAIIGLNALSLVADVGTASFPVSRTIPVDHGRLVASIDGGDFTVQQGQPGDAAQLTGTVQYSLVRPDFSVNDGTGISLHCRLFLGNCGLNATLTVPPGAALDLSSGGGDMRLSDIQSAVTLDSAGGNVSLSGAGGAANVTTGGGDLSDSGASGILHFTTSGGDVDGSGLLSPDVTVESGGGDVSLTFTRVPANIDIGSSGGDITIVLPRGATEYAISYSTAGGDYGASVPTNKFAAHKITVRSGGGDVSIIEPS